MARQWYYAKEGTQQGPVSTEQLSQFAATGELLPTDLVWAEGLPVGFSQDGHHCFGPVGSSSPVAT